MAQLNKAAIWSSWVEQWRNGYLAAMGILSIVLCFSARLMPRLEGTRFMGEGLHPLEILILINGLHLIWVPWAVSIWLYVMSFPLPRLNNADVVAANALGALAVAILSLCLALLSFMCSQGVWR